MSASTLAEVLMYLHDADPDALRTMYSIYPNKAQAQQAAAECVYIERHGCLPEWGCHVTGFVPNADGSFIFIHDGGQML